MEQLVALLDTSVADYNGVMFPQEVVATAVHDFNKRLQEQGTIPGEYGSPANDPERSDCSTILFDKVSHVVQSLWLDGTILKAKIRLIGRFAELANLVNTDFNGIPRIIGVVDDNSVCQTCYLVTVDIAPVELQQQPQEI